MRVREKGESRKSLISVCVRERDGVSASVAGPWHRQYRRMLRAHQPIGGAANWGEKKKEKKL